MKTQRVTYDYLNPFFILCLVIQSRDRFPIFIFEQYSISFRNLSCTTCVPSIYSTHDVYSILGKKVLVAYVYFGIGYCTFSLLRLYVQLYMHAA